MFFLWIQPFFLPNRSPRNLKSMCITNQIYNPATPPNWNLITNGLDSGLPQGMDRSNYALRENGYCGCHQSKSRTLCTGSRMTCTPCSLRSFRPPWTGESWNTSLTR